MATWPLALCFKYIASLQCTNIYNCCACVIFMHGLVCTHYCITQMYHRTKWGMIWFINKVIFIWKFTLHYWLRRHQCKGCIIKYFHRFLFLGSNFLIQAVQIFCWLVIKIHGSWDTWRFGICNPNRNFCPCENGSPNIHGIVFHKCKFYTYISHV